MPFGLCNAPSTFQWLMQRMLGDQQGQSLLLYLDDIIIYSSSVEQHLQRLEMVLGWLQREGLKAKAEKCAFFQQQMLFLGHVISSQGVSTYPKKVEVVASWQCPRHISELRSFLGFASYYQRFVDVLQNWPSLCISWWLISLEPSRESGQVRHWGQLGCFSVRRALAL